MANATNQMVRSQRQDVRNRWLLSAPALAIAFVAAIGPLFVMIAYSFMVKGDYGDVKFGEFSLEGWFSVLFQRDIFDDTLGFADAHLTILWRSVRLSLYTTVLTLVLGFPTAYFISTRPPNTRDVPGSLLLFPRFDSRQGRVTLLSVTNTNCDFAPVGNLYAGTVDVEFVYVGRYGPDGEDLPCLEHNVTRRLTPCDTFTTIASYHNPSQQRGFPVPSSRACTRPSLSSTKTISPSTAGACRTGAPSAASQRFAPVASSNATRPPRAPRAKSTTGASTSPPLTTGEPKIWWSPAPAIHAVRMSVPSRPMAAERMLAV